MRAFLLFARFLFLYRTVNLLLSVLQEQKLPPQFRKIACLVLATLVFLSFGRVFLVLHLNIAVFMSEKKYAKLIQGVLINGMCLFGVGGARRRPHRASSLTISTSDCAVLLRSWRTKRSGIMSERYLSMRVPSVVPRYAVAVGSLKQNAEGERR